MEERKPISNLVNLIGQHPIQSQFLV